jgi:NADPH-dependent ferric siderophore reductase
VLYETIDKALPNDPAAAHYLYILDRTAIPQVTTGAQ